MKNKSSLMLGLLCLAAIASAQTYFTYIYGYERVAIPPAGGVNFVGFNFTSDNPLYLEDVFGTNQLVQGAVGSNADQVHVWNGSSYDSFFQKSNGLFYDSAAPAGSPATMLLPSGAAVFLQGASGSSQTNTIILKGVVAVTAMEAQSHNGGGNLTAIANPYPTDLDLNGTNVDWSAATSHDYFATLADKVYIWNPEKAGGAGWDSFFLKTDGQWYSIQGGALGNTVIPAGGGAFYQAIEAFTNDIVRPFSL